jgi:alanyl-tRNA synthetase
VIFETKKLFYEDSRLSSFDATVLGVEPLKKGFGIILDKTAFYPEGGGQPADRGKLFCSSGEVSIFDVYEKDGIILHRADKPVGVGEAVSGRIDWPWRFELMQHHTAEHIVSGIIHSIHKLDNVGFHMGSESVTIDVSGALNDSQISEVEIAANKVIYENKEVLASFPSEEELERLSYRSKKKLSGQVRIVSIPDADVCACCGLHASRTGEVGIVKITSFQKYKGGTRLSLLAGLKAFADYSEKSCGIDAASSLLSSKQDEIPAAIKRILDENAILKQAVSSFKAQDNERRAAMIPDGARLAVSFEEGASAFDIRLSCLALCKKAEIAAVFSVSADGVKYAIGSFSSDCRSLAEDLNKAFGGRGGGKPELVQGAAYADPESLRSHLLEYFGSFAEV